MRRRWALLSGLAAAAVLFLASQPVSAQTQADMTAEAGAALGVADRKLSDAYDKLRRQSRGPDASDALARSQQAWLLYRDLECDFQTMASRGGSAHAMSVLYCKAGLAEERIKRLEARLSCQEGDLSCGAP